MSEHEPRHPADREVETKFAVERYKYILAEIHFLNESLHKYLSLFQALATALVGAGAVVFITWRKFDVDAETARTAIKALLGMFWTLVAFMIFSILVGVYSWLDYRREEVSLLNEVVRPGFRTTPKMSNFLRWYETYSLLLVIASGILAGYFVNTIALPSIK